MKIRGPIVTLAAVAALGTGIWLVNVSMQDPQPAPGAAQTTTTTTTTAAPPPAARPAPAPAPVQFPAKAEYVGKIPTANGAITLDITVEGDNATAYACDGNTVESWLRGPAANGTVNLANNDKTSRLEGRLEGTSVVGTLWIGEKRWDFTAASVQAPAGLYVYEEGGVRGSWIVDSAGDVTGVLRRADGSTMSAPGLAADGTAVIGGRTVKPTRAGG